MRKNDKVQKGCKYMSTNCSNKYMRHHEKSAHNDAFDPNSNGK